jgi:hypothetical protein
MKMLVRYKVKPSNTVRSVDLDVRKNANDLDILKAFTEQTVFGLCEYFTLLNSDYSPMVTVNNDNIEFVNSSSVETLNPQDNTGVNSYVC